MRKLSGFSFFGLLSFTAINNVSTKTIAKQTQDLAEPPTAFNRRLISGFLNAGETLFDYIETGDGVHLESLIEKVPVIVKNWAETWPYLERDLDKLYKAFGNFLDSYDDQAGTFYLDANEYEALKCNAHLSISFSGKIVMNHWCPVGLPISLPVAVSSSMAVDFDLNDHGQDMKHQLVLNYDESLLKPSTEDKISVLPLPTFAGFSVKDKNFGEYLSQLLNFKCSVFNVDCDQVSKEFESKFFFKKQKNLRLSPTNGLVTDRVEFRNEYQIMPLVDEFGQILPTIETALRYDFNRDSEVFGDHGEGVEYGCFLAPLASAEANAAFKNCNIKLYWNGYKDNAGNFRAYWSNI